MFLPAGTASPNPVWGPLYVMKINAFLFGIFGELSLILPSLRWFARFFFNRSEIGLAGCHSIDGEPTQTKS